MLMSVLFRVYICLFFFFQAEDGIRDYKVTGVQTCALPILSILDGWWVEGHIEGVTGWCIGESRRTAAGNTPADNTAEAESLYNKLESVILPLYYNDRAKFLQVMQHAIAINGSFFNTQRMVQQYITDAYLR